MKRRDLAWGLALVLLFAAAYADPLLLRRNFAGRDLLAYNLPMEKAVHDAYGRGRLPLWMPEVSGGRPLLPNPNAGALYPVRPLLSVIALPAAMRIFPVFHWALAALGVFRLLRVLGAGPPAAWIAAVTYGFSGVAVSCVFFPHVLPGFALLPWIVAEAARPHQDGGPRVLVLALLFALEMLSGDVFSLAVGVAAAALWIFLEERGRRRMPAVALAGSLALAALAASPQILASWLWIPQSARAVTGMKLSESLMFSVRPQRLLELLVPYPFGPTFSLDAARIWGRAVFRPKAIGLFETLYCGAFALIAVASLWRSSARGSRFSRIFLAITLAAACLPSLLPERWGEWNSPVALRNPEKFAAGIVFSLAVLAGLAYERFRAASPDRRFLLGIAVALTIAAAGARIWPAAARSLVPGAPLDSSASPAAEGRNLAVALAEAGLLWMATLLAIESLRRGRSGSAAVSLVLLTAVPIAANRRIAPSFPEEAVFSPTPIARFFAREDPHGMFRTLGTRGYRAPSLLDAAGASSDPGRLEYNRRVWSDYTPALWGRGQVFNWDFDNGDLSRHRSLRTFSEMASLKPEFGPFFGSLSLRWSVHFRDQQSFPGYHRIREDLLTQLDENERASPDIRLLTQWKEETGPVEALHALPHLAPGEVAIESGTRRSGAARPGRLRIFEKSPERLRLVAESPDPTFLFVLRGYWPYRTILLDGQPVEDSPAQIAFSAIPIPAGSHRVEWREELAGGTVSRWGPPLALLAGLAWVRRRSSRGDRR